jgi:hypothetical protein
MERYFQWSSVVHSVGGSTEEALVVCYNDCDLSSSQVYSDVENALKFSKHLPDCVYIIGDSIQLSVFQTAWEPHQHRLLELLKRGVKNDCVRVEQYVFLEWKDGHFLPHALDGEPVKYKFSPQRLLRDGLKFLVVKNGVINTAPSGHSFKHPSGTLNSIFIQARELASDEAELCLVGYAIALEYTAELSRAKKVYIDTMGIHSFVKNALMRVGGKAEIVNFHSYAQLEKMYPPSEDYFCLVSASTSGGMARKMLERKFRTESIATLIDRTEGGRIGSILLPLDKVGLRIDVKEDEGNTLIEIIGENFSAKSKPPKSVVIALKHCPEHLSHIHEYFGLDHILGFYEDGGAKKLLFLDPTKMLASTEFRCWLDAEIDWSVSMATNLIIHSDDPGSISLAEIVCDSLQTRLNGASPVKVVSCSTLDVTSFEGVTGVLVVTGVARDGGVLREISRDLRSYIDAKTPRRFLAPVGIPESRRAWAQLKTFLMKNPSARDYGFSNWLCLPIGSDSKENAWTRLTSVGTEAEMVGDNVCTDVSSPVWDRSFEIASEYIEKYRHTLLPTKNGEPLALSHGFLFFKSESEISDKFASVSQSTVYLTIASVVQCAREHGEHDLMLRPTGYESAVLSPECFQRFNDNILQACFLRACLPSELDYSASPELSKLMKEMLLKVFARWDRQYGDASLEFAAALATGTLQLTRDDTVTLLNESIGYHKDHPSALLGLLLIARGMEVVV